MKLLKEIFLNLLPYFVYKQITKPKEEKINLNFDINNFGLSTDGKDCVILGNGPSLKKTLQNENIYNFIKSKKIFCVNEFVMTDTFKDLKPDFVWFADPYYWNKDTSEPYRSMYKQNAENLRNADWEIKVFMPRWASEWNFFIDVPKVNKNVEINYLNTKVTFEKDIDVRFAKYKQNLAMPRIQNVLVGCIYTAINAGFENIYLFGADHSWTQTLFVNDENIVCYKDTHFYDKNVVEKVTPVWKDPECTKTFTIAELLEAFAYKYKSYEELEKYSKYIGSKIYNASEISFIDAFERIKIE